MSCNTPYVPKRFWQDPNEVKDYRWDFVPWLTAKGVTIASFVFVFPSGSPLVEVSSAQETPGVVVLYLSGVVDKEQYLVTCRITTTGATPRVLDRSIIVIGKVM